MRDERWVMSNDEYDSLWFECWEAGLKTKRPFEAHMQEQWYPLNLLEIGESEWANSFRAVPAYHSTLLKAVIMEFFAEFSTFFTDTDA